MQIHSIRRAIALGLVLSVLLAACGQATPGGGTGTASGPVEPVFAFSEAVVGQNRIALGLLQNRTPVNEPDAQVQLRFFDLSDTSATVRFETNAVYYGAGLPVGYYVAYPTFDTAGEWGIEVQAQLPGQSEPTTRRLRLQVRPESVAPNVGDPAIAVETPTINSVPALEQLSSDGNPDPALYQISLDEAIASGRPTAVLFATPAYCKTATCGPSLSVLQDLQQTYGEQMNFVHVEVYRYPFGPSFNRMEELGTEAARAGRALTEEELLSAQSDAMVAWRLPSEPWLFLIDGEGSIAARYEGGITREELTPALERLLAGEPVL